MDDMDSSCPLTDFESAVESFSKRLPRAAISTLILEGEIPSRELLSDVYGVHDGNIADMVAEEVKDCRAKIERSIRTVLSMRLEDEEVIRVFEFAEPWLRDNSNPLLDPVRQVLRNLNVPFSD